MGQESMQIRGGAGALRDPRNRRKRYRSLTGLALLVGACLGLAASQPAAAEAGAPPARTLIENVHIFNGVDEKRIENASVLVEGNRIREISQGSISAPDATVIDGGGRTLMPGLIDNHWHVMFAGASLAELFGRDDFYVALLAARQAEATLMRGFTTVRDVGGNSFSIMQAVDEGLYPGPRIYPSGAMISQTSGHADFRPAHEHPLLPHALPFAAERSGHLAVADGVPEVLFTVREQLKRGATHIKLSLGGGTQSEYDPLDVTQYTFEEVKAAVDAAADWNTYVCAHAYTPRAVERAIEAGVKVIEHGQLLDEKTMQLMARKGIWLSLQPFYAPEDSPLLSPNPVTRAKQIQMIRGTADAYAWAKKHGVKVVFGTDFILSPEHAEQQGEFLALLETAFGYTPFEALKQATHDGAELLQLSGPRNPYDEGALGVIAAGAYADLLLVDGNPLTDLGLVADPHKNFVLIMKDGKIYKNTLGQ